MALWFRRLLARVLVERLATVSRKTDICGQTTDLSRGNKLQDYAKVCRKREGGEKYWREQYSTKEGLDHMMVFTRTTYSYGVQRRRTGKRGSATKARVPRGHPGRSTAGAAEPEALKSDTNLGSCSSRLASDSGYPVTQCAG